MEVKNGLSSPCSVVDAEAIASLLEVKFPSNIPSCEHKTPENLNILIFGLRHIDNRLSRHDEKVCGGLRVDVLESDAELMMPADSYIIFTLPTIVPAVAAEFAAAFAAVVWIATAMW